LGWLAFTRWAAIPAHRLAAQNDAVLCGRIAIGVRAQVGQADAIRARRNTLAAGHWIDATPIGSAGELGHLTARLAASAHARVHERAGRAVVHHAVAVVVEAIADFGRRSNLALAHKVAPRSHVGAVLVARAAGRGRAGRKW